MIRTLVGYTILILVAVALLAEGEHFPIFVQDAGGNPVTGALVKAATWGSRPPSYQATAVEQGNGAYYFKIGSSCGGCVPAGTYDVWRDGVLDSAYAGMRLDMGNTPGPNTVTSSMIVNGTIDLTQDVDQTYGTGATELPTVFVVDGSTCDSTSGDDETTELTLDNAATNLGGKLYYPRQRVLTGLYTTTLNDSGDAGGAILGAVKSNGSYTLQSRSSDGVSALDALTLFKYRGCGLRVDVRNHGTVYAPHVGRTSSATGVWSQIAVDGLAGSPAGIESRVSAKNVTTAYGTLSSVYAGNTVTDAYGGYFENVASEGTYPAHAYGVTGRARAAAGGWAAAVYGQASNNAAGVYNYGVYGFASGTGAINYGVYGWASGGLSNYGGFFVGRVGADSLLIPPDAPAPASGEPTRVRIANTAALGVGAYIKTSGTSGAGLWVDGGTPASHQYGVYITGHECAIYQRDADALNDLQGQTNANHIFTGDLMLNDPAPSFTGNCGEVTIASGADSVKVTTSACTADDNVVIQVTPKGGAVDGTWWYEAYAGYFTIETSSTQTDDQEFAWVLFRR